MMDHHHLMMGWIAHRTLAHASALFAAIATASRRPVATRAQPHDRRSTQAEEWYSLWSRP